MDEFEKSLYQCEEVPEEFVRNLEPRTTVVNKHHGVPYDVYIGRGSKWGNPFSHMQGTKAEFVVGSRDEAVEAFRNWIQDQPELLSALPELKGKVLCCYCAPASCHGHVLAEMADALPAPSDTFRLIVAGGREFSDYNKLCTSLDKLLANKIAQGVRIVIVSGKARGADSLGERYAHERGFDIQAHAADWNQFGKSAGYRRNVEMAENGDGVALFWDGVSKGTKHMLDIARDKGLPVRITHY